VKSETEHFSSFQMLQVFMKVSPKEAACRRQLPSPVVANGNSFLQLVHMVDHQFKRPTDGLNTDIT